MRASKSLEAIEQDVQRVEILVGMARVARLDRYEGRALSRRKFTIRKFDALNSTEPVIFQFARCWVLISW